MADSTACAARVERLRSLMAERGYDAVILRNNPDLRWLTGAERTFDDEVAHTAVVTAGRLWLHTDSRYYNTFRERLGEGCAWEIDQEAVAPAAWAAARVAEARARVVAVEDTCDLAFFDAFNGACAAASVACLTPRLHGDICDLRMVKDAEHHNGDQHPRQHDLVLRPGRILPPLLFFVPLSALVVQPLGAVVVVHGSSPVWFGTFMGI